MATEQDENGNYNGDYRIVSWKNNTKIGTASVTIAGTNNYDYDGSVFEGAAKTYSFTGYRTIKFKIVGTNLASTTKCLVDTGKKIADRVYTGDAIVLTEKDAEGNGDYALYNRMGTKKDTSDDVKLVEGVDYTVSYSKNTNKGTATVKFTGIGNYYGTVKKTFKIKAAALTAEMQTSAAAFTVAYLKSGVKPKEMITLTYNGKTLVYGKGYTITWKNNTKVGAAPEDGSYNSKAPRYQIKGKGNFAGTLAWTNFTIEAAAQAEQVAMTAKNVLSKGTAKNGWTTSYKTTVTLVDTTNGKKLKAGTDYEKTYTYTYVENGVATDKAVVETVNSKGKNTGKISMLDETTGTTKPYMELAVTVTGKNNYAGLQKTETYRIYTQSISKMKVAGVVNQTYDRGEWDLTNKEQFPNFRVYKVTGSGKNKVQTDLNYMSDYTITYSKSPIFAGKITATIEGQGAYGGTMKVSFSIKSADANVSVQETLDKIKSWIEVLLGL